MHPDIKLGLQIGAVLGGVSIAAGVLGDPTYTAGHAIGAVLGGAVFGIIGVKLIRWFQHKPGKR